MCVLRNRYETKLSSFYPSWCMKCQNDIGGYRAAVPHTPLPPARGSNTPLKKQILLDFRRS